MSFRLPDIRKSFRSKREPIDSLENIKENDIYQSRIESITDCNMQRQCRQSLRIKEGANRIYNLSGNFFQKLDAAKAILVSEQKIERVTSMYETGGNANRNFSINSRDNTSSKSKGQITISDLKVPLLWRSINGLLFANGIYSLFCIVKAGSDVLETQLVCDINSNMDDVIFSDVMQINNVDFDAKCTVELYGYAVNHSSIALVRKNSKRRSSYTETQSQEPNAKKKCPFKFLGSISLGLSNSAQTGSSCNLEKSNYQADCDIPLFGTMSYNFRMIPTSKIRCLFRGKIEMQILCGGDSTEDSPMSYHCEIKDRQLLCWKYAKHIKELVKGQQIPLSEREDVETADQIIPLITQTELSLVTKDDGRMQLKIGTYFDSEYKDYQELLIFSDQVHFLHETIRCHIDEIEIWGDSFDFDEIIAKPTSFLRQGSVFRNSLYLK